MGSTGDRFDGQLNIGFCLRVGSIGDHTLLLNGGTMNRPPGHIYDQGTVICERVSRFPDEVIVGHRHAFPKRFRYQRQIAPKVAWRALNDSFKREFDSITGGRAGGVKQSTGRQDARQRLPFPWP